ncbi:MAG: NUDIX domain-containing protein [Candidatus Aenigmarchaeota archaeon]|nr:NUDIX domain-containing protein [Candidatus Aenigmarchaeota archaeon]
MNEEQVVGVLGIIKHNDSFLFVRRSPKSKFEANKWGFAGGAVKFTENPIDALKREIMEEVGLEIDNHKLFNIYNGVFDSNDNKTKRHSILITFICDVKNREVKLNEKEHSEFKWTNLDEMKELDVIEGNEKILEDLGR